MLVAVGDDLRPETILDAYGRGLFPMPVSGIDDPDGPIGWWSPDPRGVLELDDIHVSRSMNRFLPRFEIRVDTAFEQVIDACSDPNRPHGWIDGRIRTAYLALHDLGWCHSVEAWRDDRLVGGLYGLALGGLFAGESMFHHETNASKAALIGLVRLLRDGEPRLIDVQWSTNHLATLGVSEIGRTDYRRRLPDLLASPLPSVFT